MHRVVYICGFIALVAAAGIARDVEAPPWFAESIYRSCLWAGIVLALLWGLSELMLRLFKNGSFRFLLFAIAAGAAIAPGFYVLYAALYGLEEADFDNWGLLSSFTVLEQMIAIVLVGGVTVCLIVLVALVRHCSRTVGGSVAILNAGPEKPK